MKLLWLSAVCGAALLPALAASTANGADRTFRDSEGRAIQFRTHVGDAPLGRYAQVLRNAIHGDEIERLTVEVVRPGDVERVCKTRGAVACHIHGGGRGPRIIIAPGPRAERLLLHEYGHHLDIHLGNGARPEPNGTPRWWRARGITAGVRSERLNRGYSAGWHHAVPELFAEDYARLNGGSGWLIRGVEPPTRSVLRALRRDLRAALRARRGAPRTGLRALGQRGLLTRGDRNVIMFRTGPTPELIWGSVRLTRGGKSGVQVRLICDGRRLRDAIIRPGRPADLARRLPADARCRIVFENDRVPAAYALTTRRARLY